MLCRQSIKLITTLQK